MTRATGIRSSGASLARGFSLLEVLVSVLLVAIGLLGVSKMQAAGISNSHIARERSLVALQATSLAASMHANPEYWTKLSTNLSVSLSGTTSAATTSCLTTACTVQQLADFDMAEWARGMATHFPTFLATVTCQAAATPNASKCEIEITWSEKYLTANASTASAAVAAQVGRQQFTLVVEP